MTTPGVDELARRAREDLGRATELRGAARPPLEELRRRGAIRQVSGVVAVVALAVAATMGVVQFVDLGEVRVPVIGEVDPGPADGADADEHVPGTAQPSPDACSEFVLGPSPLDGGEPTDSAELEQLLRDNGFPTVDVPVELIESFTTGGLSCWSSDGVIDGISMSLHAPGSDPGEDEPHAFWVLHSADASPASLSEVISIHLGEAGTTVRFDDGFVSANSAFTMRDELFAIAHREAGDRRSETRVGFVEGYQRARP